MGWVQISLSIGRLSGSGGAPQSGTALTTPVLAMDPAWTTADATPDFTVTVDNTVASGDSVRLQVQLAGGDWSSLVSDTSHTITSPEDLANQISLALSSLSNASYEARVNATKAADTSNWSIKVSFTIAAVGATNRLLWGSDQILWSTDHLTWA